MLELLVLALALAAGVLWFRYENIRDALKVLRESESRLKLDLSQRQTMVKELEARNYSRP
jgi:hypothetical protein